MLLHFILSLSPSPGAICVHGVVVRPWRDNMASPTCRQHPEEKHRRLHRQVRTCSPASTFQSTFKCNYHKVLCIFSASLLVHLPSDSVCTCVFCRHIAELIFYMEELRAHVRKYGPVMQRYYVQYLSGFDAVVLNELVQVYTRSYSLTHTHW